MGATKKYIIEKYKDKKIFEVEDIVVKEYALTIFLNNEQFITLLCTQKSLDSLVIGFLYSEKIIKSLDCIESINIDENKCHAYVNLKDLSNLNEKLYGKRVITTGCGKGSIFYDSLYSLKNNSLSSTVDINYENLLKTMKVFNKKSDIFEQTGGVHSVSIIHKDKILYFEEDIGRHNALDKIIGRCLMNNVNIEDKIIMTSGRITSEIVLKCARLGIGCIISRSAATDLAINTSKELNIEVIGFARENKLNIYNKRT